MREPRKRQQEAAAARNYVAPVERSANIFDMPLDEFQGALGELRSQGLSQDRIDDLMRQYRAQASPFAGINEAATASQGAIADAGRRPVAGGLLSKPEGATGMDAVRGLQFEGINGLLGALSGAGQAVDAPMAAARGLIPQGDMALEALGTAGAAMTGGGAATAPRGSLRAGLAREGSRRVYHGGSGDVRQAAQGRGAWFSETPDLADEYAFGGGTVQQFDINPSRPIEFANAEQRRTIGDVISTAMNGIDEIPDADIPALSARIDVLRSRYGNDARPLFEYWNNDPDVADLFRTLGYDAISVSEKPGGAKTWAALSPDLISANANTSGGLLAAAASDTLNPSEQMARRILDMRAAGRAADVTDDMMAQADPQYMFNNTPLPMDEASRMARAQGVRALHGTGADIGAVDPAYFGNGQDLLGTGFYTTTQPERADRYVPRKKTPSTEVSKEYAEGGNVMPLMVREPRPFMLDEPLGGAADEIASIYRQDPFFDVDEMSSGVKIVRDGDGKSVMLDPYQQRHWTLQNMRKLYGPSDTSDVLSEAGYSGVSGPEGAGGRVRLSYDPTDIRSYFARFDPEFAHLANLNAANIDPMTGLFGAMAAEDQRRRRDAR